VQRLVLQCCVSEEKAALEVKLSIERLFYYAAYADKFGGDVKETPLYGLTCAIYEPKGTIGILCPDEAPLLAFVSLIAPALVRVLCVGVCGGCVCT
jgi:aldehyde dehydrogenase (NAD+)